MRILFIAIRVLLAIAIVAATIASYSSSSDFWIASGFPDLGLLTANFFSYFTFQSNLISAAVLVVGAAWLSTPGTREPTWLSVARAAITSYLAITAIVYNLMLRGLPPSGEEAAQWTTETLHVVVPIVLLLDWVLAPGRTRLAWKQIATIMIYPIAWIVYTMVRGPLVIDQVKGRETWYPYPFLDPTLEGNDGWSVALWIVVIAATLTAAATGVVALSRLRPISLRGRPRSDRRPR